MPLITKVLRLSSALALVLVLGCTTDSPSEPVSAPPTPPQPPAPVLTFVVTVTASPADITAGSGGSSNITVDVRRSDNGQPPPDLTAVTLTTSLGGFGSVGGPQTLALQLVNGRAQAVLFAGSEVGTATVRASLTGGAGATNIRINQAATFFVSGVNPSVGNPSGGEQVEVLGGGFAQPVRVTFGSGTATLVSFSSNRLLVRTPTGIAAGVSVGVGQAVPVAVGVTINVNETDQQAQSIGNAFTYALGSGTDQPQIFSVSPASGTNDGGTRVTIVGQGFVAPLQVFFGSGNTTNFNGIEATVELVEPGRIVAITPAARGFGQDLTNQNVDIMIRLVNTGFSTVRVDQFKYGVAVLITAMGPGSGPFTGGTLVTISGQGFDDPVAVSLGGVGQFVLSTTGTEIVFRTSGVTPTSCPANGIITVNGIGVTNIETGDSDDADLGFNYVVPTPQIFGISPTFGGPGTPATISGQNFAPNVQVLFGTATGGSSAAVGVHTSTSIAIIVPNAPQGFTFNTEPCDGDGDGNPGGTRLAPTPISVNVRNLDSTNCVATLSNGFLINPPNTTCTGDTTAPPPPPPQCSDGFDNDGDTFIDALDPQCTGPTDNSEAT